QFHQERVGLVPQGEVHACQQCCPGGAGQAPGHRLQPVHCQPVGHDQTVKVLVLAQVGGQQLAVGATRHPVDVVVGGHETQGTGPHARPNWGQVNLGQVASADDG